MPEGLRPPDPRWGLRPQTPGRGLRMKIKTSSFLVWFEKNFGLNLRNFLMQVRTALLDFGFAEETRVLEVSRSGNVTYKRDNWARFKAN